MRSNPNLSPTASSGISLVDICIRRPVLATMLNVLLVVLGGFAFGNLGVEQFPNVELPIITVTTTLRGASPEEVETSLTKPLEEIINTAEGIEELSSSSREGVSIITAQFYLERNRDQAAQDVRDKVNSIRSRLPLTAEASIVDKFEADATPVMTVAVSSPRELKELTFMVDHQLKQALETVSDVGAIFMVGARVRAVQVSVDTKKLHQFGLDIGDIRRALGEQNIEIPGGRIQQGGRELVLRTLGRMESVAAFQRLIIADPGGQPVLLSQVATVTDAIEEPRSLARLNGTNTVTLVIRKQTGSNAVKLIDALKERMELLRRQLPTDVTLMVIRDQSIFIRRNMGEITFHLILGMILVGLTVLLFLHDWRGTVIASVAIPASIVATFAVMKVMNYTINNSTMLALTFAVGVVIDDAIVVLENIQRTMEERGLSALDAALVGTREIALTVLATTLSLVVIFLPLVFMKGSTGMFFSSFGVTVASAILVSLFISFTLTPMLASRFLRRTENEADRIKKSQGGPLMRWLGGIYVEILRWSLGHRWVILLLSAVCLFSIWPLLKASRFTFMPKDDSNEFEIGLNLPEGTSLERAAAMTGEVESELRLLKIDGARAITDTLVTLGPTGGRLGKGEGDVTLANIYCRIPKLGGHWERWTGRSRRWDQSVVMGMARTALIKFPDFRSSVGTISPFGSGSGRNSEVALNLIGSDLMKLTGYATAMVAQLRKDPGLVDVDTTLSNRKPEIQVRIDREKASQFGLRVGEIAQALRTLVGGEIIGSFKENDEQYDVWLRAEASDRATVESLQQVFVRTRPVTAGVRPEMVPLGNFVRFEEERGPNQIDRYQRQRRVTVVANLGTYALGEAVAAVARVADGLELPSGYQSAIVGRGKQLQETLNNFVVSFLIAVVFMYIVLAAQFEHFIYPVAILLAVPLALPFALGWMIFLNESLNTYAIFGLFMLAGIVKKNGIMQVDYTNVLRARGLRRDDAILEANRVRLRPILMTTLLLVVSMIPIALGGGPGAAGRASMAKVIIGGQILCLLLTLLVTPVSYSVFDDWGSGIFWRRKSKGEPEA